MRLKVEIEFYLNLNISDLSAYDAQDYNDAAANLERWYFDGTSNPSEDLDNAIGEDSTTIKVTAVE